MIIMMGKGHILLLVMMSSSDAQLLALLIVSSFIIVAAVCLLRISLTVHAISLVFSFFFFRRNLFFVCAIQTVCEKGSLRSKFFYYAFVSPAKLTLKHQ
mmetsp:Transcript_110474/g.252914  ORF Transcript_110474/g.252914 Transcript_110474/m.252914 type:complete len:99 (-) Transcript_110474:329-625(-)